MVGSLIALIQRSGGVEGFVNFAQSTNLVRGRRSAGLLAMVVGMMTFIESSIVCLVTGAVARPIFDKLRMSREKLAYVCDTVSAPTCIMVPLNGWGAFILAQLVLLGVDDPVPLLVRSIPCNFYAIVSLLLLFIILVTRKDFGPMKAAERRADVEGKLHRDGAQPMISDEVLALPPEPQTRRRAVNMILPIAVMVAMVPVVLAYTGYRSLGLEGIVPAACSAQFDRGEVSERGLLELDQIGVSVGEEAAWSVVESGQRWRVVDGETAYTIQRVRSGLEVRLEKPPTFWNVLGDCSGSTAVFWAVMTAVLFAGVLYRLQGIMKLKEFVDVSFKGAAALVPLAALMVMAFAIGHLCKAELGTGTYVASVVSDSLPRVLVAPLVFLTACAIAFSTGTSFGTFAIMLPIAYPIALGAGIPPHLAVAAVMGGGVFGDHCSPISDTTIVSSMASASDHIDHVRTQLPYALTAGLIATLLYLGAGIVC
ncbi:MAG: sodium:solute symporter [bacterium]|nr:sodium:solute symporter [bacterium]